MPLSIADIDLLFQVEALRFPISIETEYLLMNEFGTANIETCSLQNFVMRMIWFESLMKSHKY